MYLVKQARVQNGSFICYVPSVRAIFEGKNFSEEAGDESDDPMYDVEWNAGVYLYHPVIVLTISTARDGDIHFAFEEDLWLPLSDEFHHVEIRWGNHIDDSLHTSAIDADFHMFRRFLEDCYLTYLENKLDEVKQTVLKHIVHSFFKMDPDEKGMETDQKSEEGKYLH